MAEPKVLAIGIDSLEETLLDELLSNGELPVIQQMLDKGMRSSIESEAHIGSGSVWPSFFTGLPPQSHGQYGEWRWIPEEMDVRRFSGEGLVPFWHHLIDDGLSVGTLDIPFAPRHGGTTAFEISEWGAHDVIEGSMAITPEAVQEVVASVPRHPYEADPPKPEGPYDREKLLAIARDSLEGIRLRGDLADRLLRDRKPQLAIINFPEIHHAGHVLWHSVDPKNHIYEEGSGPYPVITPSIADLVKEIDSQIGRLQDSMGAGTSLMIFALHGMEAGRGVPTHGRRLLQTRGYEAPARFHSMSSKERLAHAFTRAKDLAPGWMKDLYHRRAGQMTQIRLARPTMLPRRDWSRTRAFDLPADIHGWIRVNLRARERDGLVASDDYIRLLDDIEDAAREMRTSHGSPVVADVVRPVSAIEDAIQLRIPDLILHWSPEAHLEKVEMSDLSLESPRTARFLTGRHTTRAFCIGTSELARHMRTEMRTEDLHKVIERVFSR